jgi:HSP20 family protein
MTTMSQDFIRIMHALFLPAAEKCYDSPWCPAADVYRGRHGWLVKFELAGVRAEDIHLEVVGPRMTLRGVRRDCTAAEELHCYRMEIAYSEFERSLELPCDLRRADITTEYRDGMLLVRIQTEATT